jgi:ribosomal-protein-alanine N-acetyltransferase
MGGISIRRVRTTDMPYIYEIERLSFRPPYPPSYIDSLAQLAPKTFLVAEKEEKIVGYVAAIVQGAGLGHIISIAVHPRYYRQGIGTSLILRLIETLKEQGASTIRLEVRKSNIAAQKMYAKLGFKIAHTLPKYYENGEDCVVMLRAID